MTSAMNPGTPKGCERIAYAVGFQENATYSDVYGGGVPSSGWTVI